MMPKTPARALDRPIPGVPPRPRPPRAERWTLDNRLRVVAVRHATLPQVAMRLILPAGSAADPAGMEGLASLAGSLLTEGTATLTSEDFNRRLDHLGAAFSVQVGADLTEIDVLLLAETLEEGLDLLAGLMTEPAFPAEEVERVRSETLDALDARLDEPANVADDHLGELLFGPDHPYGRLPLGTEAGITSISRDDLLAFHGAHFRPDGAILVVAGDFQPERLREMLAERFAEWRGVGQRPGNPTLGPVAAAGVEPVLVGWPDAQQAEIRLGGLGMARDEADWVPAAVGNFLLGGSTITGRLGANLREDKGWTYGIRSGFSASKVTGAWTIETAVDGEVMQAAIGEIITELDRFCDLPVAEDELRRAKDALILSLPRAFETPGRIVARLATVEVFGLGDDYWDRFPGAVEAVRAEQVLEIARRYFDPARLVALSVGPEAAGLPRAGFPHS